MPAAFLAMRPTCRRGVPKSWPQARAPPSRHVDGQGVGHPVGKHNAGPKSQSLFSMADWTGQMRHDRQQNNRMFLNNLWINRGFLPLDKFFRRRCFSAALGPGGTRGQQTVVRGRRLPPSGAAICYLPNPAYPDPCMDCHECHHNDRSPAT